MSNTKQDVAKLMRQVRKTGRLPSSKVIVEETFKKLGYTQGTVKPDVVQAKFNQILKQVWTETLSVLEKHESRVYQYNIIDSLIAMKGDLIDEAKNIAEVKGYVPAVKFLFYGLYPYLREIFLSIGQSRKTRGGKDFELQFGKLLDLMNIPYQKIKRAYRVDFMIPSAKHSKEIQLRQL